MKTASRNARATHMTQEEMRKSNLPPHVLHDPESRGKAIIVKYEGVWKSQGYQDVGGANKI